MLTLTGNQIMTPQCLNFTKRSCLMAFSLTSVLLACVPHGALCSCLLPRLLSYPHGYMDIDVCVSEVFFGN